MLIQVHDHDRFPSLQFGVTDLRLSNSLCVPYMYSDVIFIVIFAQTKPNFLNCLTD